MRCEGLACARRLACAAAVWRAGSGKVCVACESSRVRVGRRFALLALLALRAAFGVQIGIGVSFACVVKVWRSL